MQMILHQYRRYITMKLPLILPFDINLQDANKPQAKATKPDAADDSASASQVYYLDASVDLTI